MQKWISVMTIDKVDKWLKLVQKFVMSLP